LVAVTRATAIVVLVILVLVLLAVARGRLLRENEEPVAAGSMSKQMLGRGRNVD
jgi:hypothetical protein